MSATTIISRASPNGSTTDEEDDRIDAAMSALDFDRTRAHPARRVRPALVGLGDRQRRLGQDACADAARHPPAARRRRSGRDPLPDLHQGRRGRDGAARLRDARQMDDARRRRARARRSQSLQGRAPTADEMRAGAAALRQGAGDAGRAEDPDDPCLLRAAAARVSVRGERARPVHRARRFRRRGADRDGPRRGDERGRGGAGLARSAAPCAYWRSAPPTCRSARRSMR